MKAAGDADAIRAGRLAAGPFQVVFKQGKRIEQPSFVCLWRPSTTARMGVAVSRQVRGAVQRNRVRRRLREACRRVGIAGARADVVLVARPRALACPFDDLVQEATAALSGIRAGAGQAQKAR